MKDLDKTHSSYDPEAFMNEFPCSVSSVSSVSRLL